MYGSGGSDYTSADGKVLTKVAYVPGAEKIITGGNVNLYDSFDTETNTEALHEHFKTVYECFGLYCVVPSSVCVLLSYRIKKWAS